jgi:hypothetical protein
MHQAILSLGGRADSGRSRPFFGEAEDGHGYFFKRDNVSHEQLVIEYVFSRLADECGLPVAPPALLVLPAELIEYSVDPGRHELSPGIAFGSQKVPYADDLRTAHLRAIDEELKGRVLCFDWWVRNGDRCLDRAGGQPNVLWDPVLQSIVLIDHDRALDQDFDERQFLQEHVFRDIRNSLDLAFVEKWRIKFESALYHLDHIWAELPEEWLRDATGESRVSVTCESTASQLLKPRLSVTGLLPG